ncbi:hypothetical protein NVP1049O_26 [Vibrio phage 1.049.O._10N.286.54.B5]|nr:hypothetical protein NVP1049O_26 [Vibrio phage 1.049.O._10N.286.54.B5]AUR84195.1 hypothetical protein NVP1050O_26 [Vibrio phage 1.050.O._10N.286.48.A6]
MYGIENKQEAVVIAKKVVSIFGGGHKTVMLMLEFAATETHLGTYPDRHPEKWGVGLTQFDQIRFDDVVNRTRGRNRRLLKQFFGYDLNSIKLADLADDALLAFCMTRLALKLVPESNPTTVSGRAHFWKKWWNTYHPNAKGTIEEYLDDVENHMPMVVA